MSFNIGSLFGSSDAHQDTSSDASDNVSDGTLGNTGRDFNGSYNSSVQRGTGNKVYGPNSISNDLQVNGSSNVVTLSDYGAVSKSLDAMVKGVEQSTALATLVTKQAGDQQKLNISTGADLISGVLATTAKQADTLTQSVVDLKTSDVRVLVIGALAIVGAVVAVMMKKGG